MRVLNYFSFHKSNVPVDSYFWAHFDVIDLLQSNFLQRHTYARVMTVIKLSFINHRWNTHNVNTRIRTAILTAGNVPEAAETIGVASYMGHWGTCPTPRLPASYFGDHSLYRLWRVMRTSACPVERFLAIGSAGCHWIVALLCSRYRWERVVGYCSCAAMH